VDEDGPEIDDDPQGLWPEQVILLVARLRGADLVRRSEDLAALWRLLNLALQKYARFHSRRLGRLPAEDVRDIASDKASDLIARADRRDWDPVWPVDDRATSILTKHFYEHHTGRYSDRRAGVTRVAMSGERALREAQTYLRSYRDASGRTPFVHPAYWASFELLETR